MQTKCAPVSVHHEPHLFGAEIFEITIDLPEIYLRILPSCAVATAVGSIPAVPKHADPPSPGLLVKEDLDGPTWHLTNAMLDFRWWPLGPKFLWMGNFAVCWIPTC